MAARPQPTARRIGLGHELRQLRKEAGLTLAQAVDGLSCDESTLQRVETGWKSFRQAGHLRELLERYGITDDRQVDRLIVLQRESSSREWWSDGSTNMLSGMPRFLGIEAAAREIRTFHPQVVPGLIQSHSYAQAVHELHKPIDEMTTEFVQQSVHMRMKRQEALTRSDSPVKLWAILHEPALRYPVGGADVMRDQYEQLLSLEELENVTLQVLPQGEPGYVAFHDISIMILSEGLPTTIQSDTAMRTVAVSDKPREVNRFSRMFDAMASNALPPRDTPKFLHRLARESAA
ncbi:helix-turn-helix domain-containing protein [Streptomyces acidiscabies]|uniref:Helix-turn-helix transcriptional regulator n=1 Tax=Streptomyces acidiscabies TaxID=42234 RepID=A0AAP6ELF4_9ACTN|nr:helix-turn-helix transcriptional regulator [Streptomyces acidiscabies]MBP5938279.1 helix-turn-helix domain-containing protein [Streptomyces sp. LBUM 1476]MBZ3909303.1 helix-turn-helix domain-containing protein [Streptomyces acidiscabies]MDX2966993.1 helix-turn-helix transcriptional regulator [Streptomyces acidiscabies]MDX3016289.1 helix-turn-helix transcriptional regulator [Streptomyces acidiscabies]MDX3797131.1 helix-turn-helix transcriptional regulator [Streptomyces acidiscabies]